MENILQLVKDKDPAQPEFLQAVTEVVASIQPVLDRNPAYRREAVLDHPMRDAEHDIGNLQTLNAGLLGATGNAQFGDSVNPVTYPTKWSRAGYLFAPKTFMTVGDVPELDFGSSGTIAIVTKLDSMPPPGKWFVLIRKQSWNAGRNGYALYITESSNRVNATTANGSTFADSFFTGASALVGKLSSLVFTWDATTQFLYLDAVLKNSRASLVATPQGQPYYIGNPDASRSPIGRVCCEMASPHCWSPIQVADYHVRSMSWAMQV